MNGVSPVRNVAGRSDIMSPDEMATGLEVAG